MIPLSPFRVIEDHIRNPDVLRAGASLTMMSFLSASAQPTKDLADEKVELDALKQSKVARPVSASMKRAMGKKTSSMSRKSGPEEKVFSLENPPTWIRPRADNVPYKVVQASYVGSFSSSATLPTFQAYNFTAASVDQIASLQALFDQYRITLIEAFISPRLTVNTTTSANFGRFASVIDYDDSTALTTFASALDYQNVLESSGKDGHYRRWRPHVAVAAYSGAFTSYANEESPWIDAVSSAVQHYGLKTAWQATDIAYTMDVTMRLHMEWRNVR
jgi:hypothetical protein